VDSPEFVDFLPSVQFKNYAVQVKAVNVFLNWFKMIAILSYSPTFGIMTDTLARAANDVAGFCVVFFIVFFGFAQSYAMIFHGKLEDFRTVGQTAYTLVRALLGDFDFVSLQDADSYMGPFLFTIFVALAYFVVLNMLIAIISDAYIICQEDMKSKKPVDLMKDMGDFLSKTPGFKQLWMCVHAMRYCCGVKRKKIIPDETLSEKKINQAIEQGTGTYNDENASGGGGGEEPLKPIEVEDETTASSYILEEWYKSLRSQDVQFQKLKGEMSSAKGDVMEMRKEFNQAMEMMITQIIVKINKGKHAKAKVKVKAQQSSILQGIKVQEKSAGVSLAPFAKGKGASLTAGGTNAPQAIAIAPATAKGPPPL